MMPVGCQWDASEGTSISGVLRELHLLAKNLRKVYKLVQHSPSLGSDPSQTPLKTEIWQVLGE